MNRVQIEGSILRSWTCGPTDHRAALSYTNRDQRSHYMPTIAVEEYDVVSGQGELNGR